MACNQKKYLDILPFIKLIKYPWHNTERDAGGRHIFRMHENNLIFRLSEKLSLSKMYPAMKPNYLLKRQHSQDKIQSKAFVKNPWNRLPPISWSPVNFINLINSCVANVTKTLYQIYTSFDPASFYHHRKILLKHQCHSFSLSMASHCSCYTI